MQWRTTSGVVVSVLLLGGCEGQGLSANDNGVLKIDDDEIHLAELNLLGHGYNIFGRYASADSVKAPVIDIPSLFVLEYDDLSSLPGQPPPPSVGFNLSLARQTRLVATGQSAWDLGVNIGVDYEEMVDGGIPLGSFKETVHGSLRVEAEHNARYTFSTVQEHHDLFSVELLYSGGAEALRPHLTAYAEDDFGGSKSASQIFNTYGTHVIVHANVGGHVEIQTRTDLVESSLKGSLEATAEEHFATKLGGEGAKGDLDAKANVENNAEHMKTWFEAQGGATDVLFPTNLTPESYTRWSSTILDNLALSSLPTTGSLIPISELISDEELKTEFEELIRDKGVAPDPGKAKFRVEVSLFAPEEHFADRNGSHYDVSGTITVVGVQKPISFDRVPLARGGTVKVGEIPNVHVDDLGSTSELTVESRLIEYDWANADDDFGTHQRTFRFGELGWYDADRTTVTHTSGAAEIDVVYKIIPD
ncbi:MAG: hypothetical protein KTR31_25735 [Myxococcales bacterium]|nr:hypothetical protein [Myxococcales bacterium]